LAVSNSIANGATVTFAGGTGELTLDDPESFSGTIVNFSGYAANAAQSDVIDLVGSNENSAGFATNYSNGVLTVTDGTDTAELTCSNFDLRVCLRRQWRQTDLCHQPPNRPIVDPLNEGSRRR
jgi:hypothetical protein